MSGEFPEKALVLYKSSPARVLRVLDKIEIELKGGETVRVRPKDVALLHRGPLESLDDLVPCRGEVSEAWDILKGGTTTLSELAELIYGELTPSTAWAAWQIVVEGLYFRGTPESITARAVEELEKEKAARESEVAEKKAWEELLARVRAGKLQPGDGKQLGEVEAVALGKSQKSRILRELGSLPLPENAHSLLLKLGHWDHWVNPHPARLDVPHKQPAILLPDLPDEKRLDLTHLPAFAIDDEGNQDPDDAISIDGDRFWVHVADVAALIAPDSPADLEARGMGSNLYLPERIVHMLPPRATELLGLGLAEISPALSFSFRVTEAGELDDIQVALTKVKVTRLTYEQAETKLEESPFREMAAIAGRFQRRRKAVATSQLELPEVKIRVVGEEIVIKPLPPLKSRELVTEAMLMAGEAAARFALRHNIPFAYTTQPPPETAEKPTDLAGMFAYRKKMRPSQMKSVPEPHSGLGLSAYARATSPLRRYLDLVVHQQLRAHLNGAKVMGPQEVLSRVGAAEAVLGTVRRAERASNQHWTLVYLLRHPGWQGKGILVDRHGQRGTVILPELGLESRVNLGSEMPLNSEVSVKVNGVNLPELSAHFMVKA